MRLTCLEEAEGPVIGTQPGMEALAGSPLTISRRLQYNNVHTPPAGLLGII